MGTIIIWHEEQAEVLDALEHGGAVYADADGVLRVTSAS